ncbi:hypothetical protein EST38_g4035 [Candolleomyces aberdarensis]|uniref:DUF6533 domain-containing protein n=1 Tax=Candolleomyces aberdarensis TaxID=2316362 RepID=A0A4Q2DQN3_9AGAR|nr:hypothetical protein EST38_g4035 [Candolleomyces aberdarensis]
MDSISATVALSLSRFQTTKYFNVAAFTYLIFDYFQTLDLEVKYIWGHKLSPVIALFMATRYFGFIMLSLLLYFQFGTNLTPQNCEIIHGAMICWWPFTSFLVNRTDNEYIAVLLAASTAAADAIMFIRIHALANRSRTMSIYLPVHFLTVYTSFYSVFLYDLTTIRWDPSPYPSGMPCVLAGRTANTVMIPLMVMLVNLFVAFILSIWYGRRNYRNSTSPLLEIFYIDGTIYFLIMGVIVAALIAVIRRPGESWAEL